MAYKLIGVGSKANSHICKFVADTYSDLINIPIDDKTFGTKCLVIDTGRIYCLNSDLNWVPQKTKATLPDVTVSDNGKIMQVENGAWAAVEGGGSGSATVLQTTPTTAITNESIAVKYQEQDGTYIHTSNVLTDFMDKLPLFEGHPANFKPLQVDVVIDNITYHFTLDYTNIYINTTDPGLNFHTYAAMDDENLGLACAICAIVDDDSTPTEGDMFLGISDETIGMTILQEDATVTVSVLSFNFVSPSQDFCDAFSLLAY